MSERQYRPSNGTDGYSFVDFWCSNCERDRNEDCPILASSFSPDGAPEWRIDDDGHSWCTEYVERGKPVPPPKDDATGDLFEETPPC